MYDPEFFFEWNQGLGVSTKAWTKECLKQVKSCLTGIMHLLHHTRGCNHDRLSTWCTVPFNLLHEINCRLTPPEKGKLIHVRNHTMEVMARKRIENLAVRFVGSLKFLAVLETTSVLLDNGECTSALGLLRGWIQYSEDCHAWDSHERAGRCGWGCIQSNLCRYWRDVLTKFARWYPFSLSTCSASKSC